MVMYVDRDTLPEVNDSTFTMPQAGLYELQIDRSGYRFTGVALNGTAPLRLEQPVQRELEQEVLHFFDTERTQRLRAAGLAHRRGILLFGPAGSGKSSMVAALYGTFVEHGALVLINPPLNALHARVLPAVRRQSADQPVVLIFDGVHELHGRGSEYGNRLTAGDFDALAGYDRLLTLVIADGRIPVTMRNRLTLINRLIEMPEMSQAVRRQLVTLRYPSLSVIEREFALTLVQDAAPELLHEACLLQVMGEDADVVRDRIMQLRDQPQPMVPPIIFPFGWENDQRRPPDA